MLRMMTSQLATTTNEQVKRVNEISRSHVSVKHRRQGQSVCRISCSSCVDDDGLGKHENKTQQSHTASAAGAGASTPKNATEATCNTWQDKSVSWLYISII